MLRFTLIVLIALVGVCMCDSHAIEPKRAPNNLIPGCKQVFHNDNGNIITSITCNDGIVYTVRDKGCTCSANLYKNGDFVKSSGWFEGPCPHLKALEALKN